MFPNRKLLGATVRVALLAGAALAVTACGGEGQEEVMPSPTIIVSTATPVPFDFSRDFTSRLLDYLRESQLPAGEDPGTFFNNINRGSAHTAGAGYVSRVSDDDTIELVIYPSGETLIVTNASGTRIRRGTTMIEPDDLRAKELVTIRFFPGEEIWITALGVTWPSNLSFVP
jgi:hypothetical protein